MSETSSTANNAQGRNDNNQSQIGRGRGNQNIPLANPEGRNGNNQRQIGRGRGNQNIPMANPHPPLPTFTERIIVIPNQVDIVSVLQAISVGYGQAIYIFTGRGYVSQATLLALQSLQPLNRMGVAEILHLSGWFHPTMQFASVPLSRFNGILHVSISGSRESIAIATSLIAYGTVEVPVTFVCGPGSIVQPGGTPIRIILPPI